MPGPCTSLTVLDFSFGMPGAICTLVMADYGADVIKVEPPGGDPFRFQPAWISWNRGKKGIVLDLSTSEGREQAVQLAGEADVLVESFRPGDMAGWGFHLNHIRHVETERHWFLGSFAIVVAGTLAFLAQDGQPRIYVFAFAVLSSLSVFGGLLAWRAGWIIVGLFAEIDIIIENWEQDPQVQQMGWHKRCAAS